MPKDNQLGTVGMKTLRIFVSRKLLLASFLVGLGLIAIGGHKTAVAPFDATIWNNPGTYPSALQTGITHHTYHSDIIGVDIGYTIYLPPEYFSNPNQRFPVIYVLHGMGGNENTFSFLINTDQTGLQPTIFVSINGFRNSKYRDAIPGSPMYGTEMIDSSFITELIPNIDATYRTVATKGGRAIQGSSMGGMGALRFAFKYPQLFSSVYAYMPAIDDDLSNLPQGEPALMLNMFNNDVNAFVAQNAQTFAVSNAANIRGMPIHVTIGSADSLLPWNQALMQLLDAQNIPHDPLQVINGVGHELPNATDNAALQFAIAAFSLGTVTPALR
jgi:enterochelin esterase-like enzyme